MQGFSRKTPRRWGRKLTLAVLITAILTWCVVKISNPDTFPIQSVKIVDAQSRVDHAALRETITPFLHNGMILLSADKLEKALAQIPWVATVSIGRQWPGELIITIHEENPAAHWDDDELINDKGTAFKATHEVLPHTLPWLKGPQNEATKVWMGYQEMETLLAPTGLKISAVDLGANNAWEIELNNGMPLILGSDNVVSRLKRFVDIYPKIFDNNANAVEYIDLRYSNGLAVKWKAQE